MASFLLALGALLMAGGLIRYWIGEYHQRELARIETAELELDGLAKIALAAITFAWQCHECGTPLLTREAVQAHTGARSSCTAHVDRIDAEAARQEAAADEARWHAEQTAAPAHPDAWPALGADDAAPELESAP